MKGGKCTKFIHLRALYTFVIIKPINRLATAETQLELCVLMLSCDCGEFSEAYRKVLVSTLQTMFCCGNM